MSLILGTGPLIYLIWWFNVIENILLFCEAFVFTDHFIEKKSDEYVFIVNWSIAAQLIEMQLTVNENPPKFCQKLRS